MCSTPHRVHTFNKIGKLDTFYQKIFLHIVQQRKRWTTQEIITKMGQTLLQSFCQLILMEIVLTMKNSLNLVKAVSLRSLGLLIWACSLSVQRLEQHSKCFQTNFCVERKMLQYSFFPPQLLCWKIVTTIIVRTLQW